jgi:hypothetical protein
MEDTKKGNTTNATVDLVAETMTDLPVAEEQAGETKGGAGDYQDWRSNFGRTT